ncbi:phenylalanine--tRNA ligase subunit beta [Thiohalocapsa marina]|uniref:Phenylalanine--tRNA ligase beta subunit n=1 Tax=Thiohalocapsa marina TaxID=424902 RepID=A0A5M8FRU1_9GAMM|nr:phenylalanine--tRNA ligase subunit beta [Thiohalocapsa marina]KAA6185765.1 phenylalanine--tRNA ligase subunit beta [Thiohalocapsa marina]
MRFSEAWLREWVDPAIGTQALADQLSMAGLEVDAVEPAAPAFDGVLVGHVMTVEPHPDAHKLRLCTVDVGADAPLQIVCGAANVAAGMRVPVATVGACLPGGFKIKKAKLRGVASFGMICSAAELGLAESSEGILPLPAGAPVGDSVRDVLALDDQCIELDLTPDRGDCLSVAGVAREVGVLNQLPVRAPAPASVDTGIDARVSVTLSADEACPRYLCRVVQGVDAAAETPLWMRERLRRSGLRPISAVVDVTNYVLLELGQPMHAFDLDRLQGDIQVRLAQAGESLALLNGDHVSLRDDTLVIADAARPVALAGIMGGAETAVDADTTNLLLESAFFAPSAISGKARSYGLHTDSSHRFERGVDPALQAQAMERATALLLDIVGGSAGPVQEVTSAQWLPQPLALNLRRQRIGRVLGVELDDARIEDILSRLGMRLQPRADGWQVTPPSSRFDVLLEEDLIAEIGRVHGYDRIPVTHARSAATTRAPLEMAFDPERVRQVLVARGWFEAITYSFISPEQQAWVDPALTPLALSNPLSAELSVMRTSLWPGLLQAARQNLARQQGRVWLFESGLRFRPDGTVLHQEMMWSGLMTGSARPEQWGEPSRPLDFFDLKAEVAAVLAASGCERDCQWVADQHPALHPGQSARLLRDGETLGWAGTLHPSLAAELDLPANLQLFDLAVDRLGNAAKPGFSPLSKYPSIRRDIAIVVDASLTYEQVRDGIRESAGELLRELLLFDVYAGEHVAAGRKSLALGLMLQAPSQTLTDQDVEAVISRVLEHLASAFGAELRG